ncbi:RAD50-interacting protein 1-like [Achlya hypogyna]|uniref:RAD50-interacting protein 1-like n=1 Tax=Achlya hypogyna TaxID=1202772 RepID=A0A1V9YFK3_ACHHY|nr:RAD50-interacting protein 1-like [Achlya hypogyna]
MLVHNVSSGEVAEIGAMERLQECEDRLEAMHAYKASEVNALLASAKDAMAGLLAQKLEIERALPGLAEKEEHHNAQQHAQMHNAAKEAEDLEVAIKDLHTYTGELCALIAPQTNHLWRLQRQVEYLKVLIQVETISERAKQEAKGNIDSLLELAAINATLPKLFGLEASLQLKLRTLITDRMSHLTHEYQKYHTQLLTAILVELDWPRQLSEAERVAMAPTCERFATTFTRLVQLQLSLTSVAVGDSAASTPDLWAMECLLKPVVRRFQYHFDTNKKTNDITKPEWFFTFVLEILQGHYDFIQQLVAPALAVASSDVRPPLDAMTMFIRGLLLPVRHKVSDILPLLLESAKSKPLLCHAIDEIVAFEKTLREDYGYVAVPPAQFKRSSVPTVLDLCAQSTRAFGLWTAMDRDYAQTFVATFLQGDTAWDEVLDGGDDLRVTNAAYAVASCLDALKQRFQALSDPGHRYGYVQQVLKPFLQHCYTLFAAFAKAQKLPATDTSRFCAALNSCHFVRLLLQEYDEMAVFVELLQMAKAAKIQQPVLRLPRVLDPLLHKDKAHGVKGALLGPASLIVPTAALSAAFSVGSSVWQAFHASERKLSTSTEADATDDTPEEELVLEGSMFENEITRFSRLVQALQADLLNASVTPILGRWDKHYNSSPMWIAANSVERHVPEVSSELSEGLALVHTYLMQARRELGQSLLQTYWKQLATELDGYLLGSILSHKTISIAGRAQLTVDVQALVGLFRSCTPKPHAYLRGICDACAVLSMDSKKAAVLKAALSDAGDKVDGMEQLSTMLEASQIHALRPSQTLLLLRA